MMHDVILEAQVECREDAAEVLSTEVAGGFAVSYTNRCPGKTTPNEDSAAIIPYEERSAILIVADGVGGGRGGELASRAVIQSLQDSLDQSAHDADSLRPAILNGIETANQAVLELGLGAASTLAVVEIQGNTIRPYHVGDSMILNVGQRGKIKLQTISHSPVGFAIESGMLDPEEAMHHEERHIVSNVIGLADMRIEIGSAFKLAPRDTLLLASDGLSDNLHLDEIINRIRKGPLEKGIQKLTHEALKRMTSAKPGLPSKPDDMTIIAYRPTKPVKRTQRHRKAKPTER